ncbi:MAG: hypothetical protein Q4E31_10765 [Intestinibacter bartlettii]|nr:hypothetical protein [Intestinibacter bartlettii]
MVKFRDSNILVVFIIVPALIIVNMMFVDKKFFIRKRARIIRSLYIISLTCIASLFVVHTSSYEVILVIIAGVLGVIGEILNKIKNTYDELSEFLILISISTNVLLTFI